MSDSILDDRTKIQELDASNVLGSIESLAKQIEHAWSSRKEIQPSPKPITPNAIIFCGMGGSALGSRIIQSLYSQEIECPIEIVSDYRLPNYVDSNSLVILSSYSGTTEETLSIAEDADARTTSVAVITAGGRLAELAKEKNWPLFLIDPVHNPSNQPRMAIGYSVFGQLALLSALGILEITDQHVESLIQMLNANAKQLSPENSHENTAKLLAFQALDRQLLLISAEHLRGAVHVMNNQLNENSKNFTIEHAIPELNHHLMEGLRFPALLKDVTFALLFHSSLYHPRVSTRFPLTADVLHQQQIPTETVQAVATTPLEQVWEIIQLGAYLNLYLAILNGIDPAPIPWVDYFKSHLPN